MARVLSSPVPASYPTSLASSLPMFPDIPDGAASYVQISTGQYRLITCPTTSTVGPTMYPENQTALSAAFQEKANNPTAGWQDYYPLNTSFLAAPPYAQPGNADTGYINNGTSCCSGGIWMMHMYRLTETSFVAAPATAWLQVTPTQLVFGPTGQQPVSVHVDLVCDGVNMGVFSATQNSLSWVLQLPTTPKVLEASITSTFANGSSNVFAILPTAPSSNATVVTAPYNPRLIAFVHMEDHCVGAGVQHKSIGVVYSYDSGATWTSPLAIVTAQDEQPSTKVGDGQSGCGDFGVVWDIPNKRWVMFFQEVALYGICMAVSSDGMAAPGTWTKVEPHSGTSTPGLRGAPQRHPDFPNGTVGSNYTLCYNTASALWCMVWPVWGATCLFASTSPDLNTWSTPKIVFTPPSGMVSVYPWFLGTGVSGAMTSGAAWLYFGLCGSDMSNRRLNKMQLTW